MLAVVAALASLSQTVGNANQNAVFGNGVTILGSPRACDGAPAPVGGTLYVHAGGDVWADVVDLGKAASDAGCAPGTTPHMVLPSPDASRVAVTYTTDRVVHVLDAATRNVELCMTAPHASSKVHTGQWIDLPQKGLFFVMVDMVGASGGGALHLWKVGTTTATLTHTLAMAVAGVRTKPIASGSSAAHPDLLVVTDALEGGVAFVRIENDRLVRTSTVAAARLGNCRHGGGLWVAAVPHHPQNVVAVFGKQVANASCIVELNTQSRTLARVVTLPATSVDAHGIGYCRNGTDDYVVVTSRVSATLDAVHYGTGAVVATHRLEDVLRPAPRTGACPRDVPAGVRYYQPDLLELRAGRAYQTTRGRVPLSAVSSENALPGAAPGLYTFTLDGCTGVTRTASDVALEVDDARTVGAAADPHGGGWVGDEYWLIDQAPSGVLLTCDDGTTTYQPKSALLEDDGAYAAQTCGAVDTTTGDM